MEKIEIKNSRRKNILSLIASLAFVAAGILMALDGEVCLEVTNPEKYTRRQSKVKRALASANHSLGFTELSVNLSGLDANTEDVFEAVIKYCELSQRQDEAAPEEPAEKKNVAEES